MSRRFLFLSGLAISALCSCQDSDPAIEVSDGGGRFDLGRDGGQSVGDALPRGAISFFRRPGCPQGWAPFVAGGGRTVVPSRGADPPGGVVGEPLADSEDRPHRHTVAGNVELGAVTYAGIAGEANHGVGRAGAQPLTVTASPASSGLPYLQLLICEKLVEADRSQRPPPAGLLLFFASPSCPSGYLQPALGQGRFLVALPPRGTPAQSFGGPPLSSLEQRSHRHQVSGAITTTSHGIALLSGGLAGGYAKDDRVPYQLASSDAAAPLPYIQLLQCQKQ